MILAGFTLAVGVERARANGFVVTYPPDSDNLSLEIGSRENVEVHLKNDLGVEVAVRISDNAGDAVNVSHPTNLKMTPGSRRTIFLTMDPVSEGNFNVAVHVSWTTPKKQEGEVGGQVIGGIDIPLKGRATAPAQPPALPLVALLVIGVTVTTIVIIVVWLRKKCGKVIPDLKGEDKSVNSKFYERVLCGWSDSKFYCYSNLLSISEDLEGNFFPR